MSHGHTRQVHTLDALGLQPFARESNTLASRVEDVTQVRVCVCVCVCVGVRVCVHVCIGLSV